MRAVDTNVLVRLLVQDDPKQAAAAEAFIAPGAWISHLVLAESVWVLTSVFERRPRDVATCIGMLLEHDSLVVQDADTVQRALDRFLERPAVGFSDCLILEIARKAGHGPLGTFDRDLAKLSGAQRLLPYGFDCEQNPLMHAFVTSQQSPATLHFSDRPEHMLFGGVF